MKNYSVKLAAKDIAQCSLFVALLTAGAYIKIPFPMVPLTFQTAFAILAGLLLGWRKGIISAAAYAALGLIGVPVFSNGGGIAYVLMPSFGYVLGFIACAGVGGILYEKDKKVWQTLLIALASLISGYAIGIAYFIAAWQLCGYEGLWNAVVTYNLLYLPKDLLLAAVAAFVSYAVTPAIKKMRGKSARRGKCNKQTG